MFAYLHFYVKFKSFRSIFSRNKFESVCRSDVNIDFFVNPDIELHIRISVSGSGI